MASTVTAGLKKIGDYETEYKEVTHGVQVTVTPEYLEGQSSPHEDYYVWAYHIRIKNLGTTTVQLLRRHWRITDANGHVEDIRGPGVVGEQPTLRPNEEFHYTSGTYLPTPSGIMVGIYEMVAEDGQTLEINVPAFSLDVPGQYVMAH